jgi:predicted metal-binding membrane protein
MADTALRQRRSERPDTPREAYRLLPPRITVGVAVALFVVGAAGWMYTIREADRMSGMVMGLGEVGGGMSMAMGVVSFLTMWAGMMVAMMAPTLVPVALAHRYAVRDRGIGSIPTVAFVVGFLLVWAATALLALVPYRLILEIRPTSGGSRWLAALGGAVLVGVGGFQFAPWKVHCLRMCRMPMAAITGMDPLGRFATSFRAGLAHGWHCLGCCWSLMVVLLVVGVMNLFWMAAIAAIFFIDKHWAHGERFSYAVGVFFVALGLVVIAFPDVLPYISGVEVNGGQMGNMGGGM